MVKGSLPTFKSGETSDSSPGTLKSSPCQTWFAASPSRDQASAASLGVWVIAQTGGRLLSTSSVADVALRSSKWKSVRKVTSEDGLAASLSVIVRTMGTMSRLVAPALAVIPTERVAVPYGSTETTSVVPSLAKVISGFVVV